MARPVPEAFRKRRKRKEGSGEGIWVVLLDGPRSVLGDPWPRCDLAPGLKWLRLDGWPYSDWYILEHVREDGVHCYRWMGKTPDVQGLPRQGE